MERLVESARDAVAQLALKAAAWLSLLRSFKHASSLGTALGLALAIVAAWRVLRPTQPLTRKPPPSSLSAAGLHVRRQQLEQQHQQSSEAADNSATRQAVKKRLNGVRRLTCATLGVVFKQSTPQALKSRVELRPGLADLLRDLAATADVYLITRVDDDTSEEAVMNALDDAGVLGEGRINRYKVLFCETDVGTSAIVRQVEPELHVDADGGTIQVLQRFLPRLLHVQEHAAITGTAGNITTVMSLLSYFQSES
eukprot:jgi/Chlat1/8253/Chrsp77S07689